MRCRIERDALAKALKVALPAASNGAIPVLACVRLDVDSDSLTLTTTNMDLTITTSLPVASEGEGTAIVGAKLLDRVATAMPDGAIELAATQDVLGVEGGDAHAELRTMAADYWPQVPTVEGAEVALTASDAALLRRVMKMASVDPNRPVYRSINLAGGKATVADGYRLAQADIEADIEALFMAVNLAAVLGHTDEPPTVAVGDRHVEFRAGSTTWTTGLTEGAFPTQAQILSELRPESPYAITVETGRLAEAVDRVCAVGSNGQGGDTVVLTAEGDKLIVSRRQADVGSVTDTLPCSATFEESLAFNPRMLGDLLDAAGTDDVTIEVVNAIRSVVVHGERLAQALMPVNLSRRVTKDRLILDKKGTRINVCERCVER